LDQKKSDEVMEGRRRSVLQLLAVAFSILTAYLASDYIPKDLVKPGAVSETWTIAGLGLLGSGGSGLWNAILTYFGKVKDIKKAEAEEKKSEVEEKKSEVEAKKEARSASGG
jgi:hypothetical protein